MQVTKALIGQLCLWLALSIVFNVSHVCCAGLQETCINLHQHQILQFDARLCQ